MGILQALVVAFVLAFAAVGVAAWIWGFMTRFRGQPLLPLEVRTPAPWGLFDVLLTVLLWFLLQLVLGALLYLLSATALGDEPSASERKAMLAAGGLAFFAALFASAELIHLRTRATQIDFGLAWTRIRSDLVVGLVAFAMLAPLVYLIQYFLVQFWPTEQELILLVKNHPSDYVLFALCTVVAVIVAPITEEYFFRVLVQGWLETLFAGMPAEEFFLGRKRDNGMLIASVVSDNQPIAARPYDPGDQANPFLTCPPRESPVAIPITNTTRVPRWPIFVSAAFFSLAHFGNGPDPIPLFVLALGLGYLYRQTHRIFPCIVVHFLLNALSMFFLWLEVHAPLNV